MRIVHVIHHYWPVVGGIENVVKALAEGMVKLGHEVHVVTSTYGAKDRPRKEVVNGVHVHRVGSVRFGYPDLTYPLDYPIDLLKSADVVHGHSQNSLFTVKIIEKAKELEVKTVTHFMAVDALSDHPNSLVRLLGPLYGKWTVLRTIRSSDARLVKSLRDKEMLKSRYGIDAVYVPDGVDEELLNTPNKAEEFKARYSINEPFVVYVGRLHRLKGIDVLIKAISMATKEESTLTAVIVGPGDQRPYRELTSRLGVGRNVVFTGFVSEEVKIGALDASAALVLPSISNYVEAFSLAITEAWARGKPVVASTVGEIPYRVRHMVNGLLIPPRNPKALADAILQLIRDRRLGERLGAEGRERVTTWGKVIDELLKLYAS
ncbi:MAG: glycosyltransferase family 4 protein [Caldivirga sp.]